MGSRGEFLNFEIVWVHQKLYLVENFYDKINECKTKNIEFIIIPLGIDKYTREEYGNKNFILNCMNYLLDDSGLISVRSRVLKLRLLDKEAIEKYALQLKILNTVFPILFIILLGLIQNTMRKRKYAR